jgi:hypothetical protein
MPFISKEGAFNLEKIGSQKVLKSKGFISFLVPSFQKKQVEDLCECSFFVDEFHCRALDNNSMAKCEQNPSSERGREGA